MGSGNERRLILLVFAGVGIACLFYMVGKLASPLKTHAELQPVSANGILVVPIQIERDSFGLAMVDTVSETLWIYELKGRVAPYNRLKLFAARSWKYDRLLQQYNTGEPKPNQVKSLLESVEQIHKEESIENQKQPEPNSSNSK